jgi:hypothetical protein
MLACYFEPSRANRQADRPESLSANPGVARTPVVSQAQPGIRTGRRCRQLIILPVEPAESALTPTCRWFDYPLATIQNRSLPTKEVSPQRYFGGAVMR